MVVATVEVVETAWAELVEEDTTGVVVQVTEDSPKEENVVTIEVLDVTFVGVGA